MFDSPAELMTFVSSVAAMVAAVAALLTILEMRKQRIAMHRPHLAFVNTKLHFFWFDDAADLPVASVLSSNAEFMLDAWPTRPRHAVKLYNVGLASATQVHVSFAFDFRDWARRITHSQRTSSIFISGSAHSQYFLLEGKRPLSTWSDSAQTIPYVLPTNSSADAIEIELPQAYAVLMNLAVYLMAHGEAAYLFPLGMTLHYFDVGGTRHRAHYTIALYSGHAGSPSRTVQDRFEKVGLFELRVTPSRSATAYRATVADLAQFEHKIDYVSSTDSSE